MESGGFAYRKKSLLKRAGVGLSGLSKRLIDRKVLRIQPAEPSLTASVDEVYDPYGFSIVENEFAEGIKAYEKEFREKKERRLKRWEDAKIDEPLEYSDPTSLKLLVRKGIPDHLRGVMWRKLLGCDEVALLNEGLYDTMVNMQLPKEISDQIELDISRTFPNHKNYKENSSGVAMLRNVLRAFANYMPSINYCQSLNFISATLLIFMGEEEAFWCLVQMISSKVAGKGLNLAGYYKDGMLDLKRDILVLDLVLQKRLKRLSRHLRNNGIDLMLVCAEWFLCQFSISLPIPTVFRVWDALFYEGEKILFRAAYSLFKLHEKRLLRLDSDKDLLLYCKAMPKGVVQHDEFLKVAFYHLSAFRRKDIQKLREIAIERLKSIG